ncbi:MAG: hypothetical protein IPH91_06120 [Elusimicrobia bacterium]|nr:hypothetical protein [Elusimicrobiota bacterium]
MKFLRFSILAFLLTSTVAVRADVTSDAAALSRWFSEELANATAFNAAASPQLPGDVHSLLGVELGVSLAVSSSKLDIDALDSLPLTDLNVDTVDMMSQLPIPLPVIHAKIGLPWGLDAGVKFGKFKFDNTDGAKKTEVANQVFGVEVRRRLMGEGVTGVLLPDVSVGLAYDTANGHVSLDDRYDANLNLPGGLAPTADLAWDTDWRTSALTLRVVASKQMAIVTPYAGLGYTRLMGDAKTRLAIQETGNAANATEGVASADADGNLVQVTGGLQFTFFPTLKLNLGGMWAPDNFAGTLGLQFNFR